MYDGWPFNFVTKEPWNVPHATLMWRWAIIVCFQRRSRIMATTS